MANDSKQRLLRILELLQANTDENHPLSTIEIGMPSTDESFFTDSLIIWPTLSGKYKFGVILYEEGKGYQVYIDADGNALSMEYKDVVSRHSDTIKSLLMTADSRWGICD